MQSAHTMAYAMQMLVGQHNETKRKEHVADKSRSVNITRYLTRANLRRENLILSFFRVASLAFLRSRRSRFLRI